MTSTCTVVGCTKPYLATGLCHAHYEWRRRHGVEPSHLIAKPLHPLTRLMQKVDVQESGCWLWTGSTGGNGRYGMMSVDSYRMAHVVAYVLFVGPVPEGKELDHLCRVTLCVNPDHLEPVTHFENVIPRSVSPAAHNSRKTHCKRGHPFHIAYAPHGRRPCRVCQQLRDEGRHQFGFSRLDDYLAFLAQRSAA